MSQDIAISSAEAPIARSGDAVKNRTAYELTPVLALHCSLGSSAQWRSLAKAMPDREVIALDLLGYGDAPAPASVHDFTLDHEVDAIEHELSKRVDRTRPLHVVGHSYGGAVALRFALRDPRRVKSIVLFEPVTLWLVKHRPEAAPLRTLASLTARDVEMGLMMQAAQRFIDFWSGPGTFSTLRPEQQSGLADRMSKVRLDFAACLSESDSLPAPGLLQMPALIMNGSAALEAMRTNIRLLWSLFPDCATAEVAGGHMAPLENRAQVDSIVASFIERIDQETTSRKRLVA
jgi:pimeloyl-ACP methyl ester carboxylesterase